MRAGRPSDAGWMAQLAETLGFPRWTEARFRRCFEDPKTRAFVNEPHGFAIGWNVEDELELHLILVAPPQRRQGLGRRLLLRFCEGDTFLEVAAQNSPALALYTAAGFMETGRRPDYYGPGQDALLMVRRIGR